MKTVALRAGIDRYGFDAAIGGARRDEERSRAKERIFSLREPGHRWEPRKQRPEFWRTANTTLSEGQSMRVFPLSNWTELDVWRYIQRESIDIPSLYFAKERPVVERDGALIMVDDDRFPLRDGEEVRMRSVRFRTLGCYPLTGAVESTADNLADLIAEMESSTMSERAGRLIDGEGGGSMEAKKAEGYF
jgi:sulfate adenylyltransferase subunit 2